MQYYYFQDVVCVGLAHVTLHFCLNEASHVTLHKIISSFIWFVFTLYFTFQSGFDSAIKIFA